MAANLLNRALSVKTRKTPEGDSSNWLKAVAVSLPETGEAK